MDVTIVGAGVAGLCCAVELAERGIAVQVLERGAAPGPHSCSWCAGGMLAPWCEHEADQEPLIAQLGLESLGWWSERFADLHRAGTLVVAPARERPELTRFAARTQAYRWLSHAQLCELEPALAERFDAALYFAEEAHLDPRAALAQLSERLCSLGGHISHGVNVSEAQLHELAAQRDRVVVDCRGFGARAQLPDLRGVRGEMLLLQSRELELHRPIRILHPRLPLYVVPRGQGLYMLGATMLESEDGGAVTARSALELLSAAYALHPAFGEARIVEMSAQVRPAFTDNLPQIRTVGRVVHVNGLYRHGFLLAPALAVRVAQLLLQGQYHPELMHEDRAERCLA